MCRWSVTQSQIDGMKIACCNDIFRSSWISLPAGSCNKLKQIEGHPPLIYPSPAQGTIFSKDLIQGNYIPTVITKTMITELT